MMPVKTELESINQSVVKRKRRIQLNPWLSS
jgi:hypothetical protein